MADHPYVEVDLTYTTDPVDGVTRYTGAIEGKVNVP